MNNKSTTKKVNGVTQLNEEMENMRLTVVDLELKARYWKAQAEIREYTLRYAAVETDYQNYIAEQNKLAEEAKLKYEENMRKLQEELNNLNSTDAQTTEPVAETESN